MSKKKELAALKSKADELGIKYAANISYDTLLKRVEGFNAKEGVEVEEPKPQEEEVILEVPTEEDKKFCNGLFIWLPAAEFTQSDKYSDRHLKNKGLFKED